MSALGKITVVESKLFLREAGVAFGAIALPAVLLLVLGAIPALRTPDEKFGGLRFIDGFVPSLVVVTLAFLGLNRLPATVASYREKGVLRRLSVTPVHPAMLLVAQLLINLVAAMLGVCLLVAVGTLVFGIDLPHDPLGFAAAFLLGASSLFALGMVVAARAPTARAAGGVATVLFALIMFLGGVYLPRFMLPEVVVRIGDYTPPGVQALQDAWTGTAPQPLHLVIMAGITLIAGAVAAKSFRWE
jgi:ABC-2 type transport system permease protein